MADFCGCGHLIPCKAHPQFRIVTDDHGDRWQITQTPLADEWPAGDPCPNDREWLCHITRYLGITILLTIALTFL